jgi:hypothetical protein
MDADVSLSLQHMGFWYWRMLESMKNVDTYIWVIYGKAWLEVRRDTENEICHDEVGLCIRNAHINASRLH